jgi:hypothetical protein
MHSLPSTSYARVEFIQPPNYGKLLVKALAILFEKLGGASKNHPPDPDGGKGWVVVLVLIVWILFLLLTAGALGRLSLTLNTLGLMVLICSAPVVSVELLSTHRAIRVVAETFIVTTAVALFSVALYGTQFISKWVLYTFGVIVVLEIGGHLVEWTKDDSIKRLSQWPDLQANLQKDTLTIDRVFRRQQITYLSIPFGFLLGLQVGLTFAFSDLKTAAACLIAILSLGSVSLAYFLFNSFVRMSQPIFTTASVSQPMVTSMAPTSKAMALISGPQLVLIVPASVEDESETRDLDLSRAATNLRKIYLLDSLHNVLLLITFAAITLNLLGIRITFLRMTVSLLISTFILCQLPFTIGQTRLHRLVLWRLKGHKEIEVSEKLDKVAPRFPAFQFLISLATTGSGSLLFFLLDEAIKNRLKLLGG